MGRLPALIAALLAGCTQTPEYSGQFSIVLSLDTTSEGSFCTSSMCEAYGMSCGARLSIGLYDVEGGAPVGGLCETIRPGGDICGLGQVSQPMFYGIPPNQVRISVAAWRPGVLPDDRCPTEDIFDLNGVPRPTFMPQPAFGGAITFDVGNGAEQVVVPLSCPDAMQLDEQSCSAVATTRVFAQVLDISTGFDVGDEQAAELDVGVAPPTQLPGTPGGTEYVIENSDTIELARDEGVPPGFAADIDVDTALGLTACTVVIEPAAQVTASATCHGVDREANPLELPGVLVPKEVLDRILTALALTSFPEEGLVVGRVVDHTRAPLAGVSLTPDDGITVQYLSSDLTTVGGFETSASGYFVSSNAPFGGRWRAVHNSDGRREKDEPRAGVVREKVTAFIVEMLPP